MVGEGGGVDLGREGVSWGVGNEGGREGWWGR